MRHEIGQSICARPKNNDRNGECGKILLEGKISINGDEDVEFFRRECKKLPIADRGPSHLARRPDLMADDLAG